MKGDIFDSDSLDGSYNRAADNWTRIAYGINPKDLAEHDREKYRPKLSESAKAAIVLILLGIMIVGVIFLTLKFLTVPESLNALYIEENLYGSQ